MQFKAIFIDIDDTLLDYIPCCREAFDYALRSISQCAISDQKRTDDELFALFFDISGRLFSEAKHGLHTIGEVMELYPAEFCARAGFPDVSVEPFKHSFRAAWGQTHTLVHGAKELLTYLRAKGYRLFAASNSFGHLQRSRLEKAGILSYFEDTYISMDIGYDKPDIRFFEEALRRCGLQANEVVMIGDSMTADILGAQNAGISAIFFDRENGKSPTTGDQSLITIHSLSELEGLL